MSINGITATGNSFATAFPLPSAGQVFAYDVQNVPSGSGVILPTYAQVPTTGYIQNSGAYALLVYPESGGTIGGLTTPYSLGAGTAILIESLSPIDWVIPPTGSGGSGTVTSIIAGAGLSGGTITTSGTIAVANSTANTLSGYNGSGVFSTVSLTTTGTSGAATISGGVLNIPQYSGGGGGGTVTTASVVSANGFAGTVANATTTPAITITTTATGILKGSGSAIVAATADADYQAPISLTTTGSSGAATFSGNTLNIPQYSGGGGSGTVTSIVAGAGLTGGTITTSGTIALATTGLQINQSYQTPAASTWTGTMTLNASNNNFFVGTLSGNTTLVITGGNIGQAIKIIAYQAASGGPYTLTFPTSSWSWTNPGYAPPAMPTTAGAHLKCVIDQPSSGVYSGAWGGNSAN